MTFELVDLSTVAFDPAALLSALVDHDVDFVVIGGIAALAHGYDQATGDADATARPDADNLSRLVDALTDLSARLLVPVNDRQQGAVDTTIDVRTFAALTSARFLTRFGVLDIVLRPDGVESYDTWRRSAIEVTLPGGAVVHVGSLDLVIRSKEAADRPKDRAALPRLRALATLIAEETDD